MRRPLWQWWAEGNILPLVDTVRTAEGTGEWASCASDVCHWTKQQEQQVLHLRKRYPLWGKRKLWRVLVRERGWTLSESTVGRIARLVRLGRVEPVSFYYGQVKPKRRRQSHHAKRWRYGMKAPGELMQADHMISFRRGRV